MSMMFNPYNPMFRQLPVFMNYPLLPIQRPKAHGSYDYPAFSSSDYAYQQTFNPMIYQQMMYNQALLNQPFVDHVNHPFRNYLANDLITYEPVEPVREPVPDKNDDEKSSKKGRQKATFDD